MSHEFESDPSVEAKIKPNHALQEPPLFKVIYINDEVTTMEFVVDTLCEYFSYNPDTVSHITADIHKKVSRLHLMHDLRDSPYKSK